MNGHSERMIEPCDDPGGVALVATPRPAPPPGFARALASAAANGKDDQRARWGRERHEGFAVGRYVQTPPLIFTADHHPVWLAPPLPEPVVAGG